MTTTLLSNVLSALREVLGSKKVMTAITGAAVSIGARYGLNLDPSMVLGILGLFAVVIGAQGASELGREAAGSTPAPCPTCAAALASTAAAPPPPAAPSTSSTVAAATAAVLCLAVFASLGSCASWSSAGTTLKGTVQDCTRTEIRSAITQFVPMAQKTILDATSGDGSVNWASVTSTAEHMSEDLGWCVIATAVTRMASLNPSSAVAASGLWPNRDSLLSGFVRAAPSRYHTDAGDL